MNLVIFLLVCKTTLSGICSSPIQDEQLLLGQTTTPSSTGITTDSQCIFTIPNVNVMKTFEEANLYCKSNYHQNASLPKITSVEQNDHVNDLLTKLNMWIGLTYKYGSWRWIKDNSTINESIYEHWGALEPNGDGNCIEMLHIASGYWFDVDCLEPNYFMCVYDLYSCFDILVNDTAVCSNNGDRKSVV